MSCDEERPIRPIPWMLVERVEIGLEKSVDFLEKTEGIGVCSRNSRPKCAVG